jgi:hypothetical protein
MKDVRGAFVDCLLGYISAMMLFELLTDNIAVVRMVCYFDLFCLCFRIQINLWKEKGGPLNQLSKSFLKAAVAATISCISPVHQLFQLFEHKELLKLQSNQLILLDRK